MSGIVLAGDRAPGSECQCHACRKDRKAIGSAFVVCSDCGNKRCPHASDHRLPCTGSNAPGQAGSVYA